ncbi:hypothetical protein SDJN03_28766, partial [Cucurbita argyrosperma subsp. sororia]
MAQTKSSNLFLLHHYRDGSGHVSMIIHSYPKTLENKRLSSQQREERLQAKNRYKRTTRTKTRVDTTMAARYHKCTCHKVPCFSDGATFLLFFSSSYGWLRATTFNENSNRFYKCSKRKQKWCIVLGTDACKFLII